MVMRESSLPVVLQLTGMESTKYGGLERYLHFLADYCGRRGFRTVLQYESVPQSSDYRKDLTAVGAEIIVEKLNTLTMASFASMIRLLRRSRPVIVHTHFPHRRVILAASLLAPLFGIKKVICMVHNFHHLNNRSRARYAYNSCDLVLAVSEAVRRDLLAGGVIPNKIKTHYLGVFPVTQVSRSRVREQLGIAADDVVIGNISFDAEFKGVDLLIHAVSVLLKAGRRVRLLQIGVDPAFSKLPELADQVGIGARVLWAGVRDGGAQILTAIDIYVQSSRYGEGLPLSIMEAMSLGLPVVATNVSGNREAVLQDVNGLIVEPGDFLALAAGIDMLTTNPQERSHLGEAGRVRYKELFDAEKSVQQLVNKYYDLE